MTERISRRVLNGLPRSEAFRPPQATDEFMQGRLKKMRERRNFLTEHPDERIQVNPQPLKEILPGFAFVCYRGSSIARDTAILGSDIDGGIVITPTTVDESEQDTYITELRMQGFRVYSTQEIREFEEQGLKASDPEEFRQLQLNVITFETFDEFTRRRESGQSLVHASYYVIYADDGV